MKNDEKKEAAIAVQIEKLSYHIGEKQILDNVNLSVKENSIVGLIGPNGSGKTTMLKHIYRALPPEKKTVYIHGREIETMSYRESAREITVLRQENSSDFSYTILEMVLMGRSPHRKFFEGDTEEDKLLAYQALEKVGMEEASNRKFSNLSGGEKQRVLIARSLAQEADILLLDEPTNHLDVHYQWLLMEIIKGLGKTVLSVFHELNLACAFCDYLYVLDDNRIVAQGAPGEVCTKELMAEVFRIDTDIIQGENGTPRIIYKRALR
ncbi:MAG: ABC transporter ATP-binding protein [Lachnospiraceae bacterium]|nr:ABC transporter ATP-binding protein [Lachnospiraceae bacterium]